MIFIILEIIVSALLIGVILIQMQGSGLSSAFGGGEGQFYRSKQSIEKLLVAVTITLSILFAVLSVILLIPR
ncbi:MAG: preprotein translocase subunit SecG [Candidatus Levybacteria bacterium]|nr:preprotein translocase subunit SecG [Candidatus Levybacteria bacterium]